MKGKDTLLAREKLKSNRDHQKKLFFLARKLGNSPISFGHTKVLSNGEETFKHILEALEGAVHHIHLEYYIVRDDEIGNKLNLFLFKKLEKV